MPFLSLLLIIPLVSIFLLLFLADEDIILAHRITQLATTGNFIVTIVFAILVEKTNPHFQWIESYPWLRPLGFIYHIGIDSLSVPFLLLITTVFLCCSLVYLPQQSVNIRFGMVLFLFLEISFIGIILILNTVLLYIFIELGTFCIALLLGLWGKQSEYYIAKRFFYSQLLSSILFLVSFILLANHYEHEFGQLSFNFHQWYSVHLSLQSQKIILGLLMGALSLRLGLFLIYQWQKERQNPFHIPILLHGVWLPLTGYLYYRFIPLLPEALHVYSNLLIQSLFVCILLLLLSLLFKKVSFEVFLTRICLIHGGIAFCGSVSGSLEGMVGSVLYWLALGLVFSSLFLVIEYIFHHYDQEETSMRVAYLAKPLKLFIGFCVLCLAGIPGTGSFPGLWLIVHAIFEKGILWGSALITLFLLSLIPLFYQIPLNLQEIRKIPVHDSVTPSLRWVSFSPLLLGLILLGTQPNMVRLPIQTLLKTLIRPF